MSRPFIASLTVLVLVAGVAPAQDGPRRGTIKKVDADNGVVVIHANNQDRTLPVAKDPMLCQRCHVSSRHPATIYDGTQIAAASNRAVGRSCVNCHSQIHGSNHPAGEKFLR